MRITPLIMFSVSAAILASPLGAGTLVYEPFAYSLEEGADMKGVPAASQGLAGKYRLKITPVATSDGTGTAIFNATGLEFGPGFHPVSGGAVTVTATAGSEKNGLPTRTDLAASLSASPTGTIYYSYLCRFDNDFPPHNSGSTTAFVQVGDLILAPNGARNFRNSAGVGFGKISTISSDFNPLGEAVYLVIGKLAGSEARIWILEYPSYEQWLKKGAREEHLAEFSQASAVSAPADRSVNTGGEWRIEVFSGNFAGKAMSMTVDELVIAASLADVTTGSATPD